MRLPVADQVSTSSALVGTSPAQRVDRLVNAILQSHLLPASFRTLTLRDAWRVVRDVVEAVERGAVAWELASGEEKRELALAVIWRLIEALGGAAALRAVLLAHVPGGGIGRRLVSWFVTDWVVRAVVRFTLELAVRESGDADRRLEVTGLRRGDLQPRTRSDDAV